MCSDFSEIRSFLLHSNSSEYQSPYHLLNELETEIQRCGDNNRVQSLITDFSLLLKVHAPKQAFSTEYNIACINNYQCHDLYIYEKFEKL